MTPVAEPHAIIALAKSVLCIPGAWKDQNAFIAAVADTGRYVCAGGMLIDLHSKSAFNYRFEANDVRMAPAFRAAGPQLPESLLKQIERHRSVLYLISFELNLTGANAFMRAAAAVLDAGGLAVKVETAGLAHTAAQWQEFCAAQAQHGVHQAFVVYVSGAQSYSCGMHNLGLFDASFTVADVAHAADAVEVLRTFNWYQISESPQLEPGQNFATQQAGPVYELGLASTRFMPSDPFYNAFGTWQLALGG